MPKTIWKLDKSGDMPDVGSRASAVEMAESPLGILKVPWLAKHSIIVKVTSWQRFLRYSKVWNSPGYAHITSQTEPASILRACTTNPISLHTISLYHSGLLFQILFKLCIHLFYTKMLSIYQVLDMVLGAQSEDSKSDKGSPWWRLCSREKLTKHVYGYVWNYSWNKCCKEKVHVLRTWKKNDPLSWDLKGRIVIKEAKKGKD